jgi:hypothetical protein
VGVIGGIPFLVGLGMFWKAAWNSSTKVAGLLPMALTTAVLVGSLAVPLVTRKFFWLTLAFAIASQIRQDELLMNISKKLVPRDRGLK